MLDVLLESKAQHTRRFGGTLASAVVHGAIITGAVLLTVGPPQIAQREPPEVIGVLYPTTRVPELPHPNEPAAPPKAPTLPHESVPIPAIVPTIIPPIDATAGPITPSNLPIGPRLFPPSLVGESTGPGAPTGEAIEARLVEKPPRVLRSETPHFPEALRARGQNGRIVVQFVVDTLGRAEMSEFKVVDATDEHLADAVRAVLPRFRFTAGEAAGRKVRTLVALPFDFTLVR